MTEQPQTKVKSFKEFLENTPPGQWQAVSDVSLHRRGYIDRYLAAPDLYLYCDNDECKGYRFFESENSVSLSSEEPNDKFLVYVCRNCKKSAKTYAINIIQLGNGAGRTFKYGEVPSFGPPTPSKAITLIGGDKDLFLTGRRSENQGMGVGAFTYYRRVVENQKNRIFDEIIRVTNKISPDDPVVKELEKAKQETQFTKAVETIKHALPQSLLINGFNPLTLLHSALSEGVHQHTDAECLELATSIRTILIEFADRLGQALKEEAELNAAVSRLAKKKTENSKGDQ